MKASRLFPIIMTILIFFYCEGKKNPSAPPSGYDLDHQPPPRFVRVNFIDAGRMARISKFRSAIGMDYSDDFESCRSMMHHFEPRSDFDWPALPLYTPVAGEVTQIIQDANAAKVSIQSLDYPDFQFHIFNIAPLQSITAGSALTAGQQIGTHAERNKPAGIAVSVNSTRGLRLISYFSVITDSLWHRFGECHVPTMEDFIIGKEQRDADPLTCSGTTFTSSGQLQNWSEMKCHWDVDTWGYPRFVEVNYIDFDRIFKISKFRSAVGHDFSDDFEKCRSMKHYLWLNGDTGWETARLYVPVNGVISQRREEFMGSQIWIRANDYPDFEFGIFHIKLQDSTLAIGDAVTAGQLLGTHFTTRTYSDIAVSVESPRGRKLISYFEVISDALWQRYQNRGLTSRGDVIITKEERDAALLGCTGEAFISGTGVLEDWVTLK